MTLSYLSFLYLKLHQMKMQSFPSLQYLVSTIKGLKLNGQRMVPVITMIAVLLPYYGFKENKLAHAGPLYLYAYRN